MNTKIITIASFGLGVGIGAFVTWLLLEKKYKKFSDEEIASVKETFNDRKERVITEIVAEGPCEKRVVLHRDTYKKIARQYGKPELAEREHPMDDDEEKERDDYDDPNRPPYIISLEEFSEECGHYDKLTISFYADDEILVDEDEEIITDIDGTVGENAVTNFGYRSEDPDIVYVRNEKLSIDYEIIRLGKSYSDTIGGGYEET